MFRPPSDPRYRPIDREPSWLSILAVYAVVAAIPLALWIASRPLVGVLTLAVAVGLVVVARRTARAARRVAKCREVAFDLGETVRITVVRTCACESN